MRCGSNKADHLRIRIRSGFDVGFNDIIFFAAKFYFFGDIRLGATICIEVEVFGAKFRS
ncbi:hypothetical protein D3C72_2349350 [compost metagenome]